jgi:hypothetical protein
MSNNLGLSQIAPAQSAKYATSNTADGQIDAALTEVLSLEVDHTNAATLTDEQFRRHFFVDIDPDTTPPDAAVTITVPAIKRGPVRGAQQHRPKRDGHGERPVVDGTGDRGRRGGAAVVRRLRRARRG